MLKSDRKIIIVRNWQLFIGIVVLLVQITFGVGMRAAQNDDNSREIAEMKQRRVVEMDVYENEQAALREQLNRVEEKVDKLIEAKLKK